MSRSSPSGKGHSRMAEPRFNNPYFWPPPPTMPSQLDNLVLINKIKEQLMAEKIRPPHLPPTSASSQQPLLVPPAPAESSQAVMSLPKLQQVPGLHPQAVPQPDVALHARPATSTVTGLGLSSRTPAVSTSESSAGTGTSTPSTPTTTSQSRLIASSPTLISGITSPPLLDSIKTIQGHGLLGPPKSERGRKKIKAENPGGPPVLVVPYPILASGETAKEGKTYRCKVCPLTFFTKSEMQIHSKSHTEAKPHKCPHCSKSFANASYLAQHLRIHLGVKPYHCSYCDKSFRQLSHLQQHTRDEETGAQGGKVTCLRSPRWEEAEVRLEPRTPRAASASEEGSCWGCQAAEAHRGGGPRQEGRASLWGCGVGLRQEGWRGSPGALISAFPCAAYTWSWW
ncbi:zinc finger protein 362 isoform X3 [Equus asinus]|uniref:zinc finger protein 362 isoform X3 n=1 Tax=Equus asinus TaxID=9793 RepID=UPI0038F6D90D